RFDRGPKTDPCLVQRCVIIQRDENGFGLTVSGDNPVFVQLVKEDGAAMRAGVQTGDRIIKVNGTLVTHSNHLEVVKLIRSGSYVALTVLGRPPGLPQIPLEEEKEGNEEGGDTLSAPHSPALSGGEQGSFLTSSTPCSPQDNTTSSSLSDGVRRRRILSPLSDTVGYRGTPCQSPDISRRDGLNICTSPEAEDHPNTHYSGGSPPYLVNPQIIGAEDDYFESSQEQINGECTCFQSIESLKSRPAHLAVFLHHVVSQFDPAPLLCYLYADMYKQTNSKESRRFFIEFHTLFMDRTAVSWSIRLDLIPDSLCKQYIQTLQDALLPDLHRNLEDFRQKRSMGLTLAEDELCKLDSEPGRDQQALEKECSCAEHILFKIEDILLTSQNSEEEKWQTMQYVILTYMKHLGVKVKEHRGLEHKRARITFPRIKIKQRPPKLPQSPLGISEPSDPSATSPGRIRDGSDTQFLPATTLPTHSSPTTQVSEAGGQESESSKIFQFLFPVSLCLFRMEVQGDIQSEDDQGGEAECEEDPLIWQVLVPRGVLMSLTQQEINRQEVINELFYTERAHLRMLKVLDCVFCQRLNRDGILPPEDIKHIFINLEEIIQLHVSITEQMTAIRKRNETSVIGQIGDDLLGWFSGEEEQKLKRAVATFCSNQPSALELIKTRQKKDQKFNLFMQEAQSNRLCRRLQLKDIIPVEMQRVTKYPLLLDNIAKYTEDIEERKKVKRAGDCCKKILNHVNQAVKEAENKQRLEEYQRRLEFSSLKQSENPVILELKNLDLTKRKMVHEGPLSWKVNKEKTIELYTLLLEDIMVLLQKQDERLVLKFHGKNTASVVDTKHTFSPIIKLNTVLVRPVATDNKSFFVLSMSENGAQIYELTAQTVSDQRMWQHLITQCADAMKAKPHRRDTPPPQSDAERDAINIINNGMPKLSKDETPSVHSAGIYMCLSVPKAASTSDIQDPPESLNPFDGLRSEDEEEELPMADRQEEEEQNGEVDEAELEAFLDGQLAERLLQEGSRLGIALENEEEHNAFVMPCSKAEEALKTRGFVVLDFPGSEESSTDDDVGVGSDVGIDMRKLLSSSSQMGGGGPNLSRQLMTHLRLLQADLQYLKDEKKKCQYLKFKSLTGI
uniref:Rho guanine nucleotide exchange factor 12 n=1 Tax=Oreochromis niloticus TaxID=8128 RepID=A0A669DRA1_ORENI